ncbi:MAG: ATP-binding protein [bacterium]|nr:ATP-binding protein [bacterium]
MNSDQNQNSEVIADLRKSLAWMDLVLSTLSEGVLVIGNDFKIIFANDAIAGLLNKPRIYLFGQYVWDALPLIQNNMKPCNKHSYTAALKKKDVKCLSGTYVLSGKKGLRDVDVSVGFIEEIGNTVMVIKDITLQKQNEIKLAQETAYVKLHQQTAAAANQSRTIEEALKICLTLVCQHTKWSVGHVYLRNDEGRTLVPLNVWFIDHPKKYKTFIEKSNNLEFKSGMGLPGYVLKTGKPIWASDISINKKFPRHDASRISGLVSGFAFPIRIKEKVVGVLEFFSTNANVPSPALLEVMSHIGTQLGRVIERNQAEAERIKLAELQAARVEAEIAKEKIQLSEIRYRTMIEQSPLSMQIFSTEGITIQANKSWEKLWGTTLDKIAGYNILQDQQLVEQGIMPYIKKGFSGEATIIPAIKYIPAETIPGLTDILYKWVQAYIYPIKNTNNVIKEVILIHDDITERKELEKQKDNFIGVVSHELKTPVTSLKAFGQMLQYKFNKIGDTSAAAQLGKMDVQINKLSLLIEDLLDVTKVESGQLKFNQTSFDFDKLVSETVEQVQLTSHRHKIQLRGESKKMFFGDKDRIGQVIINLLSNAIKYSPQLDKIVVTIVDHKNSIELRVRDYGIGISKEKQARVFERFFRETGPREDTFPGLGLGLFISKEIITRLGGTIGVKSEKEKGSTFYFTLPL